MSRKKKNPRNPTQCHYCNCNNVSRHASEHQRYMNDRPKSTPSNYLIKCEVCGVFACAICLQKLYLVSSATVQQQPFWQNLREIAFNGPYERVPTIQGACCMIGGQRKNNSLSQQAAAIRNQIKELGVESTPLIDGFLYLPQYNLFIDSPNTCVDIHGLGDMKGDYGSTPHCVPNAESVLRSGKVGAFPKPVDDHPHLSYSQFYIPNFDKLGNRSKKKNVSPESLQSALWTHPSSLILFYFLHTSYLLSVTNWHKPIVTSRWKTTKERMT